MNIFVLTGAGVSVASVLGTFRDKDGLWSRFDPLTLATPKAFARDPDQVHAFYNMRRQNLLQAEPNAAHFALAYLEAGLKERGGKLFLCTQNIDDLHERAGTTAFKLAFGEDIEFGNEIAIVFPHHQDLVEGYLSESGIGSRVFRYELLGIEFWDTNNLAVFDQAFRSD
jgi:NAD-dependent deacetylase